MSEEKKKEYGGVMLGVIKDNEGGVGIGINILGQPTIIIDVDHAGLILGQLGDLLDTIGYFDDDTCDGCSNVETGASTCKVKH